MPDSKRFTIFFVSWVLSIVACIFILMPFTGNYENPGPVSYWWVLGLLFLYLTMFLQVLFSKIAQTIWSEWANRVASKFDSWPPMWNLVYVLLGVVFMLPITMVVFMCTFYILGGQLILAFLWLFSKPRD